MDSGQIAAPVLEDVHSTKSRVLIINTGGRGGRRIDDGGNVVKGFFQTTVASLDDLRKVGIPAFDIVDCKSLHHSADIGSNEWRELADLVEAEYHRYNGFVVVHGTDTMVLTATALSFMLLNLGKPVIFTGSLIPADMVHTDLKRNLILALVFAAAETLSEVGIVFAERLFRANRTVKVSSVLLQPYASPNFPPLAVMKGKKVQLDPTKLRPAPRGRLVVQREMSAKILTVKLVPGITAETLLTLVNQCTAKAIVICAYGTGNCPIRSGAVREAAKLARRRGMIVAICSQVRYGNVDLASYEAGRQLIETGVVGVEDMTIEATIVKLKYLLGLGLDRERIGELLVRDLRGEITVATGSKL